MYKILTFLGVMRLVVRIINHWSMYKNQLIRSILSRLAAGPLSCDASFEMDGDKAKVKEAEVAELKCEKEAADGCPVDCIKINEIK